MMTHSPGESGGEDSAMADARRAGKRELSTSKRAAQNRAAQVSYPFMCMLFFDHDRSFLHRGP